LDVTVEGAVEGNLAVLLRLLTESVLRIPPARKATIIS
jgi:hypothetical protein